MADRTQEGIDPPRYPRRTFVKLTAASLAGLLAACAGDDDLGGGGDLLADPGRKEDAGSPDQRSDPGRPDPGQIPDPGAPDPGPDPGGDTAGDTTPDAGPDTFDPRFIKESLELFPQAVQAGNSRPDGALLWTFFTGSGPLRLVVFSDGPDPDPGVLLLDEGMQADEGGFIHAQIGGLDPGTWVRYAFMTEEEQGALGRARSPIGRFRTALAPNTLQPVTFGGVSCLQPKARPLDLLAVAAAEKLDFFILAGDTVYADGSKTLADYLEFWSASYETPAFRSLHTSTSFLATWDDHEVANDWDPETIDPALLAAATQAFFKSQPIPRDPKAPSRIWHRARWGRTLEVFVLDCRGERKPSTRKTENAEYISPEQMAWLKEGLLASKAVFKLIVSSVPITDMPLIFVKAKDRWEGYAAQREEILALTDTLPGVLWLAGDFHFPAISYVGPPGGPHSAQREVFMGPGAQFENPAWIALQNGLRKNQFLYLSGENNYTRFTADPTTDPPSITVAFIGQGGTVLHERKLDF